MKRLKLLLVLSTVLLFSMGFSVSAFYTDVDTSNDYADAAYRLSDLGLLSGYTDGSFRPFERVTRAQVAKMIVCIMDKEDAVQKGGFSSKFPDVPDGHWAVPYINYITQSGIIKGYADGTFAPEREVTYAEITAIMLRMLKYDETFLGYNWPQNYTAKANSLGWNQGMVVDDNSIVSRALIAMIIDDALFTDLNKEAEGVTQGQTLLSYHGDDVLEDVIVMSVPSENDDLAWNEMTILEETGSYDGDIYISDITLKNYTPGTLYSHVVIDSKNNHIIAAKRYEDEQSKDIALRNLGYSILTNCHIISSSSYDRTLTSGKVRTSKGEFESLNADILTAVGEYGTIILNKNRQIVSYTSKEADYAELIITDVDGIKVEYMEDNSLRVLELGDDFPIYIDYGPKRAYKSAVKEFSGNSLLTLYSSNGNQSFDYGLLETTSGYTVFNDCFVAATKSEDSALVSGQVKTSEGTYKLKNSDIITSAGALGTMVLDENQKICGFVPKEMSKLSVTINRVTGNEIEYIGTNGVKGSITLNGSFVTYVDYSKSNYGLTQTKFTNGTNITLYGEVYGDWEFVTIDSEDETKPVLAKKNYTSSDTSLEGITINHENLVVYRDGKTATLADIRKNDVVYYNTNTNIMDVYTKKVTGIYYDAKPTKAYVTTVTVGGKDYTIGTIDATNKLDASVDAYEIGARVTLLLGKNDEVVFVTDITGFDNMSYGVLLSTGTRLKEVGDNAGTTEYIATMFMPDGQTYDFVTDKNYKTLIGELVNISNNDYGKVSILEIKNTNTIAGEINKVKRTIGGIKMADNAVIIQKISGSDNKIISAEVVNFEALDAIYISEPQVLSVVDANDFGDIGILYVQELTDEGYQYGVLASKKMEPIIKDKDESSLVYYIYTNGQLVIYPSTIIIAETSGGVMFKVENGEIIDIKGMGIYESASKYDVIDETRIKIGKNVYNFDTNVKVYKEVSLGQYEEKTITDLKNAKLKKMSLYSNELKTNNGRVKVIVYTEK